MVSKGWVTETAPQPAMPPATKALEGEVGVSMALGEFGLTGRDEREVVYIPCCR